MESLLTLVGGEGQTLHHTCQAVLRYNSTLECMCPPGYNCSQDATVKRCLSNVSMKKNRLPYSMGAVRTVQSITTIPRTLPEFVNEESDWYETVRTRISSRPGMVRLPSLLSSIASLSSWTSGKTHPVSLHTFDKEALREVKGENRIDFIQSTGVR